MKPLSDISQTLRIILFQCHMEKTVETWVGRDDIGQLLVSPRWGEGLKISQSKVPEPEGRGGELLYINLFIDRAGKCDCTS